MRAAVPMLVPTLLLAVAACSSEPVESQVVELWSENEALHGEFVPDPDPPAAGRTEYAVTLTDAAGSPVEGATLEVDPWMPAHGHGTHRAPEVHEMGEGQYHVVIFYNMGGHWEITVEVESGSLEDRFVFHQEVFE